ncbi:AAA family ATPase, partial [filamentous cyanobacterium CCP1]
LDLQLKVDLPDEMSRLAILHVHNSDRPLDAIDLSYWASQTEGWNGADLALLSNQAALEAVRRFRAQGQADPTTIRITTADFTTAHQLITIQKTAQ